MEAGYYAINRVNGPMGGGISGAVEVQMLGVAKDETVEPYSLNNEYVGNRLASALGLPCPPGTIAITSSGQKMFVSLRYSAGGTSLPPVDAQELVADHASWAAGIVAFDVWIANWDRHAGQIAYVRGVSGVSIIDHGRALLRLPNPVAGGPDITGVAITAQRDETHLYPQSCLLPYVSRLDLLEHWSERIDAVPDALLDEVCASSARLTLCTQAEAAALGDFLKHRKKRVLDYLRTSRPSMPLVTGWSTP